MSEESADLENSSAGEAQKAEDAGHKRFRILAPLGEGMLGASFEGTLPDLESPEVDGLIAIKKCSHFFPDDIYRFQQDFEALCRLEHPGLVPYRELVVDEGHIYLVRDLSPGTDLKTYLERPASEGEVAELTSALESSDAQSVAEDDEPDTFELIEVADEDVEEPLADPPIVHETEPLTPSGPVPDHLDLVFQRLGYVLPGILAALEYLHRFRKVHGNLKPTNILVGEDSQCRLADYGIVPGLVPDDDHRPSHPYLAPELEAHWEATSATDLFALGAILYEAIAGRCPVIEGEKTQPVFLSEIAPSCPAGWVELIHGLMQRDPSRRPGLFELRRIIESAEARSIEIPPSVIEEDDAFLGRADILEPLIERAKLCAQERQMALALIEGATGVGKSALVDALGQWASQRGWLVVRGKCYDRESVPFQGWDAIIGQLAYLIDQLPEKTRQKIASARRRASALFPVLAKRSDATQEFEIELRAAPATPHARRVAMEALRQLIAEVAKQRPILISLDDIHLASSDTAQLMVDFVGAPQGTRCLVVATWRPDAPKPSKDHIFWSGLESAPIDIDKIELTGFSKIEARQYVLTSASTLDIESKQSVLRQGAFHPLLLEELIYEAQQEESQSSGPHRALANEDTEEEESTSLPGPKAGSKAPSGAPLCGEALVDERLSSILTQRIAHLHRPERLVLQLLAVASGPLSAMLIDKVIATELGSQFATAGAGQEVAERLVSLRLAKRTRGHEVMQPHLPRYVVLHDVGRKLVLTDLGRDHHARLCNAIADALELHASDRADLRFEYLLRASKTNEASQAAQEAASNAQHRFAFHRAARLWRWVVEHPEARDQATGRKALIELARCEYLAGHFETSADLYETLAADESEIASRAAFHLAEARAWLCAGDAHRTALAIESALNQLGESLRPRTMFAGLLGFRHRAGNWLTWTNLFEEARPGLATEEQRVRADIYAFILDALPYLDGVFRTRFEDRLMRLARQTLDAHIVRNAYFQRSPLYRTVIIRPQPPWPEALVRQLEALLRRMDDEEGKTIYTMIEGSFHHQQGRLEQAQSSLSRGAQGLSRLTTREDGIPLRFAHARARLALDQADFPLARKLARTMLHLGRDEARALATGHGILAEIGLLCGDVDDVAHHLHLAREALEPGEASLWNVWLIGTHARWNIAMGQPEVAVGQIDMWIDTWQERGFLKDRDVDLAIELVLAQSLAALADAQRLLAHPRQSETHRRLKSCIARLRGHQRHVDGPTSSAIYRLMARFEMIRSRYPRAMRFALAAIGALEHHPYPLEQAKCAEVRALVLLRMEKPEARQAVEQARALYTHYGSHMPLLLEGWPVPRAFSSLRED